MSEATQEIIAENLEFVPITEHFGNVAALGIFAIFLGTLGLISLPFAAQPNVSDYLGERGGVYADHSPIATWGLFSTTLYCGLSLIAVVGGAGCLRLRAWARPLMLGYGALALLLGIVGIYFHWQIIVLSRDGQAEPTFAFRFTSVAEWGIWAFSMPLAGFAIWTMLQRETRDVCRAIHSQRPPA